MKNKLISISAIILILVVVLFSIKKPWRNSQKPMTTSSSLPLPLIKFNYGEFDYRVIPYGMINSQAPAHFILAGDSNIFGDGCHDEETIPAILSKDFRQLEIYNWGLRGGGPHDTLYLMEFKNALNFIKQKNGIMIYNFYPFLFERIIGSKNYLKWSRRDSPYYVEDDNNIPIYHGTFKDRFFITAFYKFINSHKVLDYLIPKLPQIHRSHIKLTANIFKKMDTIYKQKFPSGKFIIVINNTYSNNPRDLWQSKQLELYLKENHISYKIFNYIDGFKEKYTFQDGHINYSGQLLGAELYRKLLKEHPLDY